jgi:hypothetical protein
MDEQVQQAIGQYRTGLHASGLPTQPETETATVRTALWIGAVSALAGIGIAIAHDVPTALAIAIGLLDAAAILVLTLRWDPHRTWRWYAVGVLTLVTFWPSLVWLPWLGLAAIFAFITTIVWILSVLGRREERERALNPNRPARLTRGMRKAVAKSLADQATREQSS